MPTLYASKPIRVTLSGTGSVGGQRAKVINRTTGEVHPTATAFSTDKQMSFDCADFASGYTAADVIEAQTSGPCYGNVLITLSGSKAQTATLTATQESTSLPAGGN